MNLNEKMLFNVPDRKSKIKGKITYTNHKDHSNLANISQIPKKKNQSNIFSPIQNEEKNVENSSSDSEFMSILGSERNLICKRQDEAVLKTKVKSGNSAHKLSNFILYKQGRNRNEANKYSNVSSESHSFINGIHSNYYNNNPSRYENNYSRIIHDLHNISEIDNDPSNYKVTESGNFFKSNLYGLNANTTYNEAKHRKNQNSNHFNQKIGTKIFSDVDKDIDGDFKKMNKSVFLLSGENDFYVKKKRMFASSYNRIPQQHANENSLYGGRIDLINHMKFDLKYLKREKLNELILIQSAWRSHNSRKIRRLRNIITIQSHWRGYWLRLVVYNSIFKYYSGRAFLEHIDRIDKMNRLKYGQILITHLNNTVKDQEINEKEKFGMSFKENNITYVKSKKIVIFKNDNEKKEGIKCYEISNNVNSVKKNFAAERYEDKENLDQNENHDMIFIEEESNLAKMKEKYDCEPEIYNYVNTNSNLPEFVKFDSQEISPRLTQEISNSTLYKNLNKEIRNEKVDVQFEFKDNDENNGKLDYNTNKTHQTISKLEIIREYLENKINSMELIQNESFNITSNLKQIKKFDSLLEEFNSFTIEINKLTNATKNYVENVLNFEFKKDETFFKNNKFTNDKLLKFEAESFDFNREIEKFKSNVFHVTQFNLDYEKLEDEVNVYFKEKNKIESPQDIMGYNYINENDTSKYFEAREEKTKNVCNTKTEKLRNNRNRYLDFSESDSEVVDGKNNEIKPQSNLYCHDSNIFVCESYRAYDLIFTSSSSNGFSDIKLHITNPEGHEILTNSTTKCDSNEFKFDLYFQKAHEIYYLPGNQKKDSIKSLEINEGGSLNYNVHPKRIQLDVSNEYNILYNPKSDLSNASTNEDYGVQTEKISTEFVISENNQICLESNPKKVLIQFFKEAEVNYYGIDRINHEYQINQENNLSYMSQPKLLIPTDGLNEEFNLNGIKRFRDIAISKENEFNYLSLIRNLEYNICNEADFVYITLPAIKNFEINLENEINYKSIPKNFDLEVVDENSINYLHQAKIFELEIFNEFVFNFYPLLKENYQFVIDKVFEINFDSNPKIFNLEITKESDMVYNPIKLNTDRNEIFKGLEFVYNPDPKMISNLLLDIKENTKLYQQENKEIYLQQSNYAFDLLSDQSSKSEILEIYKLNDLTYLPESKPSYEIFNLYTLNHIMEEQRLKSSQFLQIESSSGFFLDHVAKPEYEIFKPYETFHLPLERMLSKDNFYFEINSKKLFKENQIEFNLHSFILSKIREFSFNNLEYVNNYDFSYETSIVTSKSNFQSDNCISLCLENDPEKGNLLGNEVARISYDKFRGVNIKNISQKISQKIKIKFFNRFAKIIQKIKNFEEEKLLKNIFSLKSICKIINKRNKNSIKKRFHIWISAKSKISNKLIATIVVKKITNVINKNIKSLIFEDLIYNLEKIRIEKLKTEKIKSILNKLDNANHLRTVTEFHKWKIINIRKNLKDNIYRLIYKKILRKGDKQLVHIYFDLWEKNVNLMKDRIANSKIFLNKLNLLFSKSYENLKLKCFDQLKIHGVSKIFKNSIIQTQLKYLFVKQDKKILQQKWNNFRNNIARMKDQENLLLIKQIDILNLDNRFKISLRKIISKNELKITLQKAKSFEKWKNYTSSRRIKSYEDMHISNNMALKIDLIAIEKVNEEKEVSCDFRNFNYPLELTTMDSLEMIIKKPTDPYNKLEIISRNSIEYLTKEKLHIFDIQQAYDIHHFSNSIPFSIIKNTDIDIISSAKEKVEFESYSQTDKENLALYDVYQAYNFSLINKIETLTKETNTELQNYFYEKIQSYEIEYSTAYSNKELNHIENSSELSVIRKSCLLLKFIQIMENKFTIKKLQLLLKWKYIAPPLSERKLDKTTLLSRYVISTINENFIQNSYNDNNSSADMISFLSNSDSAHQEFTEEIDEESQEDEIEIESIRAPRVIKRQIIIKEDKQRNNRSHSIYTIKKFLTLPNGDELEYDLQSKIYSIFVKYENPLLYYFNKWIQTNTKLLFKKHLNNSSFSSDNEVSINPHIRIIKTFSRGNRSSQLKKFRRSVRAMRFSAFAKLNLNLGYYFSRWKLFVFRFKRYASWFRRQIGIKKAFLKWKNSVIDHGMISVSGLNSLSFSYKVDEESLEIKPNMVTILSKLKGLNNSVSKIYESNQDIYEEISEGEEEEIYSDEIEEENFEKIVDKLDSKDEINRVKDSIANIFVPKRNLSFCFRKWREISKRMIKNDFVKMKLMAVEYIRRKILKKFLFNKWKAFMVEYKINRVKINNKLREVDINDGDNYFNQDNNLNGDCIVKVQKINVIKVDKKSGISKTFSRSHGSSFSSSSQLNRLDRFNTFTPIEENISIKYMKLENMLDRIFYKSGMKGYLKLWKNNAKKIIENDIKKENKNVYNSSDSYEVRVETEAEIHKISQYKSVKTDKADEPNPIIKSFNSPEIINNNTNQNQEDLTERIVSEIDMSHSSSEIFLIQKTKYPDGRHDKEIEERIENNLDEVSNHIRDSSNKSREYNFNDNHERLSVTRSKIIESLLREEKMKKYSFLSKLSIDLIYKNLLIINSSNSYECNLKARIFLKSLRDVTERLLNLNTITNRVKSTFTERNNKINEDNQLNILKNSFTKWNKIYLLESDFNSKPNKRKKHIETLNKYHELKHKQNRDKQINNVLSKIISHKFSQERLILCKYYNKYRSTVKKQILTKKAEILIKQSKMFLEENKVKKIKSLKIDNFAFIDSSLLPTNRNPIQTDPNDGNFSERKPNNPYFSQNEQNLSEKLVRTKTYVANNDIKNRFPDILDTSEEGVNILRSSFSLENEEDDHIIISVIEIQNAWRYFKQKKYLMNYSIWLKFLNKLLKKLNQKTSYIMQGSLIKWKKFVKLEKLNEASNIIKYNLLKQRNLSPAEEKLIKLIETGKRQRFKKIINKLFLPEFDETHAAIYMRFKKWRTKSYYIVRCKASDNIKIHIGRYIAWKKIKILLHRAFIQFTFRTFLLFADMYNCKDRVTYLTYVLNKIIKRVFIKHLKLIRFNKTVVKLLVAFNEKNLIESKREILKLWLRKMKLLRRKDHSMLKMLRIIKLNVKNTVITTFKVWYLIGIVKRYECKYLNNTKRNLFKEFKISLEEFVSKNKRK